MNPANAHPILIKHPDHLETAMGLLVTLVGVVSESKVPTLLGVEIESESPDLRGKPGTATGLLERSIVTQEDLDRALLRRGQFANRGPGTFYRLVDRNWGNTVQVQPMV
jgi:hypothetical protein